MKWCLSFDGSWASALRRARSLLCLLGVAATAAAQAQTGGAQCPPQLSAPTPQQVQEAAGRAKDRGFLWRISKDGRSSHLYGTIHVGQLDWVFAGPKLRAAVQDTQVLALELDPLDPAIQAGLRASGAPALPTALNERLKRALERGCVPLQAVASLHPVMQAMSVMIIEAARDNLHIAFGQEFALAGAARARNLRIVSLETPQRQLDALVPKDAATAHKLLASTLDQLESGTSRRVLVRMAAAWERGDLDELAGYERWCDCIKTPEDRAMVSAINDDRNPDMADKIAALHGEGQRVFAAVGALHMTGPKALPELMKARGFTVERIDLR